MAATTTTPPPPPPQTLGRIVAALGRLAALPASSSSSSALDAALTQAQALLALPTTSPEAATDFLVFFLRDVLPRLLDVDAPNDTESEQETAEPILSVLPWVETFLSNNGGSIPQWCVLVALSDALSSTRASPSTPAEEQAQAHAKRLHDALFTRGVLVEHVELFIAPGREGGLEGMVQELTQTESSTIDRVLQALILLPVRLANLLAGPVPSHLSLTALLEAMTQQVLTLYSSSSSSSSLPPSFSLLWGALVHKACKMGQTEAIAKVWVETLLLPSSSFSSSATLVEALPLPALEPLLLALLKRLLLLPSLDDAHTAAERGLLAALQSSECGTAVRTILVNKLLLSSRRLPRAAALLIVRLLAAASGASLPSTLLSPLVRVWKERHFLQKTDMRQQEYITYALVTALAAIHTTQGGRAAMEGEGGLVGGLLEGVSAHLASALEPVRLQGMRVAEGFAKVMGQDLVFDELKGRRYEDEGMAKEEEEEEEKEAEAGADKTPLSNGHAEEQEDEDLLEPLDLSDDEADLAAVAAPRYLRRTIEFLRVRDEDDAFDKLSSALKDAEALVRSRPADLPDLGCTLARELLTLENRFSMEDFVGMRTRALVALISTVPERVAPMLAVLAYDTNMAFGTRLEVLDLLIAGARDLSGVGGKQAAAKGKKEEATAPLLVGGAPRTQGKRGLVSTSEGGEGSKTRRWGYRRNAAPATFRNQFGPVAARAFFRPLLNELLRSYGASSSPLSSASSSGGVGSTLTLPSIDAHAHEPATRVWARDSDEALAVSKTIHALATFVECSGHSPGTAALAEELLVLAWPLKDSTFPELRRAVLLSVACALSFVNVESFVARGGAASVKALQAMTAWTAATCERDPDEECRKLALMLVGTEQHRQQQQLAMFAASSSTS